MNFFNEKRKKSGGKARKKERNTVLILQVRRPHWTSHTSMHVHTFFKNYYLKTQVLLFKNPSSQQMLMKPNDTIKRLKRAFLLNSVSRLKIQSGTR